MTQKKYWRVSNRTLLLEASFVWLFASLMLYHKGYIVFSENSKMKIWILLACLLGGIGFYMLMFAKISGKYIKRIYALNEESRHVLAFFKMKGFIMMAGMIFLGIILRKTGIVPIIPLAYFYFFMGTPLLISSMRFLHSALCLKTSN